MKELLSNLLLQLVTIAGFAQGYVAPSPDAFGIGNLANVPSVNYYTGNAVMSLPLAQISGTELTVPIGLTYNASGHKVQEIASAVGLGWHLNGSLNMITRVVRHLPDDLTNGFCKPSPQDNEPDLYFYNFLGQSGKFILDKNGNAITVPYRNIIIKPGLCKANSNGSWEIIDENGVIYKFGVTSSERETTTVKEKSGATKTHTSAWFLSEVSSPNQTDKIQFYYGNTAQFTSTNYYFTKRLDPCHNTVTQDLTTTITTNTRYVSSITTALGTASFAWSGNRKDLPGGLSLTSVTIRNNQNQQLAKIRFEYSYFQGDGCTASDCYRLRLDKIYDSSPDPLYTFYYNTTVNLPRRTSKNFDLWGYYNSNTVDSWFPQVISKDRASLWYTDQNTPPPSNISINFPGASREADATRTLANMLNKIESRNGGSSEFVFQAHSAAVNGTNETVGGARIESITTKDGLGNSYTRSFKYVTETNPNLSSGLLYKRPRYVIGFVDNNGTLYRYYMLSQAFNDISDLNGAYIGYSRVEEIVTGVGKTVYQFKNFDSNPNYIDPSTKEEHDFSWQRGHAFNVKIFDAQNNPISEVQTDYQFNSPNKRFLTYRSYIYWQWSCSCGFLCLNTGDLTFHSKLAVVSRPTIVTKQTSYLFAPGNPSKIMAEVTDFAYDLSSVQLVRTTRYDLNNPSKKYISETKYVMHRDYDFSSQDCASTYADCMHWCSSEPDPLLRDYCVTDCQNQYNACVYDPPSSQEGAAIHALRNRHQIAIPIETSTSIDQGGVVSVLSAQVNKYQIEGISGTLINLKESWGLQQKLTSGNYVTSKLNSAGAFVFDLKMKKLMSFDIYDQSNGNLLRTSSRSGITTQYDYHTDYGKKLLTSVAVNPSGGSPQQRSYTHKPLVGPLTETDINGIVTKTDYDPYGRVKMIKDGQNNILRRYRYHYKGEKPGFLLNASKTKALANESISFNVSDVVCTIGGGEKFLWDLGDGRVVENVQSLNHTYSNPGSYNVKAVMLSSEYEASTKTIQVSVYKPMIVEVCVDGPQYVDMCGIEQTYYGSCTVPGNTFNTNLTASLYLDNTGCPSNYQYYWEYKNVNSSFYTYLGNTATVQFFGGSEGSWEVRCTVTDECGNTRTGSQYITYYKSIPNCSGVIMQSLGDMNAVESDDDKPSKKKEADKNSTSTPNK